MKAAVTGAAPLYLAEYRLRRGVDDWLWIRARGRVVQRDGAGRALRLAGTYTDINDAKIAEGRLRRLAEFDTLTGLPNRALFNDRLRQGMARAARGKPMALLFLDIDRFKSINDTYGHEAGDKLLKVFASRMQGAVRQSDTVARLAGDEFTIILEQLGGPADAQAIARQAGRGAAPAGRARRPHARGDGEHRRRDVRAAARATTSPCCDAPTRRSTRPSGAAAMAFTASSGDAPVDTGADSGAIVIH